MNEEQFDIEIFFKETDRKFPTRDISKVKISLLGKAMKFLPLAIFVGISAVLTFYSKDDLSQGFLTDIYLCYDTYATELAELIYQIIT